MNALAWAIFIPLGYWLLRFTVESVTRERLPRLRDLCKDFAEYANGNKTAGRLMWLLWRRHFGAFGTIKKFRRN